MKPSAELVADPLAGFDPLANSQIFKVAIAKLNTKVCNLSNQFDVIAAIHGRNFQKHALLGSLQVLFVEQGSFGSGEFEHSHRLGHVETKSSILQKI